MIVLVLSDKRVLTGWETLKQAQQWERAYLAEDRSRTAYITQTIDFRETPETQLERLRVVNKYEGEECTCQIECVKLCTGKCGCRACGNAYTDQLGSGDR